MCASAILSYKELPLSITLPFLNFIYVVYINRIIVIKEEQFWYFMPNTSDQEWLLQPIPNAAWRNRLGVPGSISEMAFSWTHLEPLTAFSQLSLLLFFLFFSEFIGVTLINIMI